jgi:hypothetical protein
MPYWIYDLVFYCVWISILIPIILLAKQFNHQPSKMRWLMVTLILSFIGDLLAELSAQFKILFVNFGGNFYGIMAPIFFAFFFASCLGWEKTGKSIIYTGVVLMLFALYNCFFLQGKNINSYSATLLSLFILALSIVYFYKLLKELPASRIQDIPLFWIISAFFFTHAGKLVFNIVTSYMTTILKDNLLVLWTFHNILTMIGIVAVTKGVWLQVRASNNNVVSTGS